MHRDILKKVTRLFVGLKDRWTGSDHYCPSFNMIDPKTIRVNAGEVSGDKVWESLWDVLKESENFALLLSKNTVHQYSDIGSKMGWCDSPLTNLTSETSNSISIYNARIEIDERFFQKLDELGKERKDILYTLRPHRFGFLPKWMFGLLINNGEASQINSFVQQWMEFVQSDENHYAYYSNLLVLQRVIALCWSLRVLMLMNNEHETLRVNLLKILAADLTYLRTRIGQSVANNHLLIDYFGGWFIEFALTDLIRLDNWGHYEDRWLSEWNRQVYDDGAGFESSTHYHELVCEISATYVLLKQRGKHPVQQLAIDRLKNMLQFQLSLAGISGLPFHMGNATEDPMFPLCETSGWTPGALREIYRSIYDSSIASACTDDSSVEKAYWLLDGGLSQTNVSKNADKTDLLSFPCGGLLVLDNANRGDRIIFRTGPNRNQEAHAGHAHADLNSVYLTDNNNPIWVDSGTYTYRYNSSGKSINWKEYFVSPQSHNCLTLDNIDPLGTIQGDFRHAKQRAFVRENIIYKNKEFLWVEGELETDNIFDGVRRGVILVHNDYWIIYDCISTIDDSATQAELRFQCADGCKVSQEGSRLNLDCGNAVTSLQLGINAEFIDTLFGSIDPLGGWVSESYGVLNKAPQIRLKVRDTSSPVLIVGRFSSQSQCDSKLEEVRHDKVYVATITTSEYEDCIVISLTSIDIDMSQYVGLDVHASMLWLRRKHGIIEKAFVTQGSKCNDRQQCRGDNIGVIQLNV